MRGIQFVAPGRAEVVTDAAEPQPGEALIEVLYCAICGSNRPEFGGTVAGAPASYPTAVGFGGHEAVGRILEPGGSSYAGGDVVLFQPATGGAFAERATASAPGMALVRAASDAGGPTDGLAGYVVAQPLATVLRAAERLPPVVNRRCSVVGLGPIGLMWTALLRSMGAAQIVGYDVVPWRCELAREYGADEGRVVDEVNGTVGVDIVVEAVGTSAATNLAISLAGRGGTVMVFGVPHEARSAIDLRSAFLKELTLVTRVGGEAREFFATAVAMVAGPLSGLRRLATPIVPIETAQQSFERYFDPVGHPGFLKATFAF
jgi:L-iditol 2-dehydrogenase